MKIENILSHKFKAEEVVTLELLEKLNVFGYPNELMEVSGQASSEFALEALLKKVMCHNFAKFLCSIYLLPLYSFRWKKRGSRWNLL